MDAPTGIKGWDGSTILIICGEPIFLTTTNWHADTCCHQPYKGRLILSLILAYDVVEVRREDNEEILGGR